jgi:hypothetical protein
LGFTAAADTLGNLMFVPLITGLVEYFSLERRGQILLGYPMITVGVWIEIPLAVPKAFAVPAAIPKMGGDLRFSLILDGA